MRAFILTLIIAGLPLSAQPAGALNVPDDIRVPNGHVSFLKTYAEGTWQSSIDTSAVWAKKIGESVDPKYVAPNSIPWFLLEVVGSKPGPTGGSILSRTSYIQRINTAGGTTIHLWEPATGKRIRTLKGHTGPVKTLVYSKKDGRLISCGDDRKVLIWDSVSDKPVVTFPDQNQRVENIAVGGPDERFIASVEAVRRGEEPPEDGYRGEYVAELAAREGDPVPHMLAQIEATLERFRIQFDTWERESDLEPEVPEAVALLDTYEADGAVWARTTAHGDDKDRVLVRSNGTPTYFAKDAAYIRRKLGGGFDRLVYVLGADHHGYVARLQALAEMLGHSRDAIEVLIYQLVQLVEGGEAKKMSKRRGDVVFLDELIDAIGVDAARWYLVSRGHDQTIELDVDLARERTNKNPVYYVQYAHARIAGIRRNAVDTVPDTFATKALTREERELVKRLLELPQVVREATERRAPHAIPIYAIRVADDFHRFYHHHRVLDSENESFRLALVNATQSVLARCLDLIGVEAPERM